jgi:2-succinyl-5-enolpyruvyl-6-hydroxy-3-cyclohexene-1-carboxylate synthase
LNFPNINYVWSNLLVEELVRNGIEHLVISPGSRNSPLVIAAAENKKINKTVHLDERGAAFFALGIAKSTGKPAALIATSGTAAANYLPAIAEANLSAIPLLVLTADRPIELRDTGAHQTMIQTDLYGKRVKWSFDLPAPTTEIEPNFILTTIDQAIYHSLRQPSGPVHINCQFREPLAPESNSEDFSNYLTPLQKWFHNNIPLTNYLKTDVSVSEPNLEEMIEEIKSSKNGLVVIGPLLPFLPQKNIRLLLSQLNWPVIVDIASGLRFGGNRQNMLIHYEYFLRSEHFIKEVKPDFILHLGGIPRSKVVNNFIKASTAKYLLVQNTPFRQDPFHQVDVRLEMSPDKFGKYLVENNIHMESKLVSPFFKVEKTAAKKLEQILSSEGNWFELAVIRSLLENVPANHNLFLSNSMPIRDADACGIYLNENVDFAVNFGVNGIDGTIASAVGFALGNQKPTTVILGDLAFLHDLNSLQFVKNSKIPVVIFVLNNNGGGIFSFLPIAKYQENFENFFGTPHNLEFQKAASLFGLEYHKPENLSELISYYRDTLKSKQSCIIEIKSDRQSNYQMHQKNWTEITNAVDKEFS